jgi:hypothetical protein
MPDGERGREYDGDHSLDGELAFTTRLGRWVTWRKNVAGCSFEGRMEACGL